MNVTEEQIWQRLLKMTDGNKYGAAGLMGNLKAESNLNSTNLQNTYEKSLNYSDSSYTSAVDSGNYNNFVNDEAGYGIAQWTYSSRKQGLLDYAKETGRSIGDVNMQLDYLEKELSEKYPGVLTKLKNAKSVKEASDVVMVSYENPKNKSSKAKNSRASIAEGFYDSFHLIDASTTLEDVDTGIDLYTASMTTNITDQDLVSALKNLKSYEVTLASSLNSLINTSVTDDKVNSLKSGACSLSSTVISEYGTLTDNLIQLFSSMNEHTLELLQGMGLTADSLLSFFIDERNALLSLIESLISVLVSIINSLNETNDDNGGEANPGRRHGGSSKTPVTDPEPPVATPPEAPAVDPLKLGTVTFQIDVTLYKDLNGTVGETSSKTATYSLYGIVFSDGKIYYKIKDESANVYYAEVDANAVVDCNYSFVKANDLSAILKNIEDSENNVIGDVLTNDVLAVSGEKVERDGLEFLPVTSLEDGKSGYIPFDNETFTEFTISDLTSLASNQESPTTSPEIMPETSLEIEPDISSEDEFEV